MNDPSPHLLKDSMQLKQESTNSIKRKDGYTQGERNDHVGFFYIISTLKRKLRFFMCTNSSEMVDNIFTLCSFLWDSSKPLKTVDVKNDVRKTKS